MYLLVGRDGGDVDTEALHVVEGGADGWYLGVAIDTRDLDADGLPELAVSAPAKDTTGVGFIVSGAVLASREPVLPDDATHTFQGSGAYSYWGSELAFLGDIDGDGIDDIAMAASYATVDGHETAGRVAVFSLDAPFVTTDDANYMWEGYYVGGRFGETIRPVGDVDGDGLPDTLVTAQAGDIFTVVPAASGTFLDVAISRVTRAGTEAGYRVETVGSLDGDSRPDVFVLGWGRAYAFTGLGTFGVRTQEDAWLTLVAPEGSEFTDAVDLGDRTGDGLPETLLTRPWSPADETAWAGVLLSTELAWRAELDADAFTLVAHSTRPTAFHGEFVTLLPGTPDTLVLAGLNDDRGATRGGSVAMLAVPE